jgi:hypothetical protein
MSPSQQSPGDPSGPRRFHTNVRHYHRSSAAPGMASAPVGKDGKPLPRRPPLWLRIVGITLGVLALGGIISGLIIELSA